jgi:hypothetical protein
VPLTDDELSAAYRELTGPPADRRDCPGSDMLARAAAGDLDAAERDGIAAHVERCAACAEEFRIACGLQIDVTAGRRILSPPWWRHPYVPQTVAASLALVCVGLLAWNLNLQQRATGLETQLEEALRTPPIAPAAPPPVAPVPSVPQPQVNVPIVDLVVPSQTRGQASARLTIRLQPDTTLITFIVNTDDPRRASTYTLTLLDAGGNTVWAGDGIRPGLDATLSVALPVSLLRPGDYVFALVDSGGTTLHRYPVSVVSR